MWIKILKDDPHNSIYYRIMRHTSIGFCIYYFRSLVITRSNSDTGYAPATSSYSPVSLLIITVQGVPDTPSFFPSVVSKSNRARVDFASKHD